MLYLRLPSTLLAFALSSLVRGQTCSKSCESFGVDFQDGGSYFQNINSTDPFTAFQEFEGCQNNEAHNILVDPTGAQYECSETPMQPDDSQQLVTCPIDKDQLTSGKWSLIVLSNNGQCDSVNFIRQFALSVGSQVTTRTAATVTVTTTSTPITVSISTSSSTITSTARPVSTTVPGTARPKTITDRPFPKITIVTKGVGTITITSTIAQVVATQTATTTRHCSPRMNAAAAAGHNNLVADRVNSQIVVTVGDFVKPSPTHGKAGSTKANHGRVVEKAREVIQVRSLAKRHPDLPTTTLLDPNAPPVVSTLTSLASTITLTGTSTRIVTTTLTPTITVTQKQSVVTVTLPQNTITNYWWIPFEKKTVTTTAPLTATITSTVCGW